MNARGEIEGDGRASGQMIAGLLEAHAMADPARPGVSNLLPASMIARELAERFQVPVAASVATEQRRTHLLLLKCLLDQDRTPVEGFIADIKARQIPFISVYRHLIAPAMNLLGEMWSEDAADFALVTIASSRMQSLVHDLADSGAMRTAQPEAERRILFTRPERELHTLGLATAIACFSNAGWSTHGGIDLTAGHGLENILGRRHFDVLGISVGGAVVAREVAAVIEQARKWSMNDRMIVALGGPLVSIDSSMADDLGADICASDAVEALAIANRLVDNQPQHGPD